MSTTHPPNPDTEARPAPVARAEVLPGISVAKSFFLLAAGLSFLASVSLFFTGDHERGIFVGIWVPSILSAGTLLLGADSDD